MRTIITALFVTMATNVYASPESDFWAWFVANKANLEALRPSDSSTLEELSQRLKSVHKGLVYEMSLNDDGETREFIVSGDGLREMIPVVKKLTEAAPVIDGWKVIAFRPRMKDYSDVQLEYAGVKFQPKMIWFYPITTDGHFDLILYHPDYTGENRKKFIGGTYILLDMAIGEFDVMTKVRFIDHQKLPKNPEREGLLPLTKLRSVFDAFHDAKFEKGAQPAPGRRRF